MHFDQLDGNQVLEMVFQGFQHFLRRHVRLVIPSVNILTVMLLPKIPSKVGYSI
jgi:hypothetical protein